MSSAAFKVAVPKVTADLDLFEGPLAMGVSCELIFGGFNLLMIASSTPDRRTTWQSPLQPPNRPSDRPERPPAALSRLG